MNIVAPHVGMYTELVINNRCKTLTARLPFRNPPPGYQINLGRKDLLGHEIAIDSASRSKLELHNDGNKKIA